METAARDDLRGSRALTQRLNRAGANALLRSLLIDLRLYARPGEDLVRFMWTWFAKGRTVALQGRERRSAAAAALDEGLRETTAPILQDLLAALLRTDPEDASAFVADLLYKRLCAAGVGGVTVVQCKECRVVSHLSLRRGVFESSSAFPSSESEYRHLLQTLLASYDDAEDLAENLVQQVIRGVPAVDIPSPSNDDAQACSGPFVVACDTCAHICSWKPLANTSAFASKTLENGEDKDAQFRIEVKWTSVPAVLRDQRKEIEGMIPHLFSSAARVELEVLAGGYSSAFVFKCRSWCSEGREEEQSVVKIDDEEKLHSEVARMETAAPYLGDSAPTVLAYTRRKTTAGVRIQLCGACWTLPRFIKENSTLILTLKSLYAMQYKDQRVLQSKSSYPSRESMMRIMQPPRSDERSPRRDEGFKDRSRGTRVDTTQETALLSRRPSSGRHFVTDFEDLLSMVFGEVMAKCYEDSKRKAHVDLVELYDLRSKMQRGIFDQMDLLRALELDRLGLDRARLGTAEDIARFFAGFLRQVDGRDMVNLALQHNDLNGNNVLVDAMGMAWVIDFADFEESHIVRDLAKLETCLMFEYTPLVDSVSVSRALQFWRARLPLQGLEPLFVAVGRLRQFVADLTENVGRSSQHAFALLAYTLDVLRYPDVSVASKLWALQSCILRAQEILADQSPAPAALYAELQSTQGLDLEGVETRYLAGCRLKHAYYTDAVTCERLPISPRLALAYNATVCMPENVVSERLEEDFDRVFLLREDVEDGSLCGRLAIFGNSGMGKTLLVSLLVTRLVALTNLVPYVVNAVELAQTCTRLASSGGQGEEDLLDVFWSAKYGSRALRTAMLRRARAQGRLVIVCDGLSQAAGSWEVLLRRLVALSRPLLEETESEAPASTDGTDSTDSTDDGMSSGMEADETKPRSAATRRGMTEVLDEGGEMSSNGSREHERLGEVRLVLATRPLNDQIQQAVEGAGFIRCHLQPLEEKHILAFAETYMHRALPRLVADALRRDHRLCQDTLQVSLLLTSILETTAQVKGQEEKTGERDEEEEEKMADSPDEADEEGKIADRWKKVHRSRSSIEQLFSALIDHNLAPLRLPLLEQTSLKRILAKVSFDVQVSGQAGSFFSMKSLLDATGSELDFEGGKYWIGAARSDVGEGAGAGTTRLLSTSTFARALNALFESVHMDAHPLLRCRDRAQPVLVREYAIESANAQAYLAASYAVASCRGREDLEQLMRRLLQQPNCVGDRVAKALDAALRDVTRFLVSDRVREDVEALETEVQRRLGGGERFQRVGLLVESLLARVKNPRNRANLRRVSDLYEQWEISALLSVVESNLAFLAFLVEMLPIDLREVLVNEVMAPEVRDELLCMSAGSTQFAASVVPALVCGRSGPVAKGLAVSACTQSPRTGWSVLMHCAASCQEADVLRMLLACGANVDDSPQRARGLTALHEACRSGTVETVRVLVDEGGACVNQATRTGLTPLLVACNARRADIAAFLISRGALLDATTESGLTAGYYAAKRGCIQVLTVLAEAEVDSGKAENVSTYLREHRVHVRYGSREEHLTLLGTAVKWGRPGLTQWLLAHGADPDVPIEICKHEILPVWLAAKMNGLRSVRYLSEAGCRFDVCDSRTGCTPLLVACLYGRSRVVDFLVSLSEEHGVDVCARSTHGESCLELALRRPFVNVTRVLVERADLCGRAFLDAVGPALTKLSQSAQQASKALSVLRLVFESRVLGPRARDSKDVLALCVRNFAAHDNVPALEFLVTRVPQLREDGRLVSVMLPVVLRARNLGLARRLVEGVAEEEIQEDATTAQLRSALMKDGIDDDTEEGLSLRVDCGTGELENAIDGYLAAHAVASPFVLSDGGSGEKKSSRTRKKKMKTKTKTKTFPKGPLPIDDDLDDRDNATSTAAFEDDGGSGQSRKK
ncbi:Ankyrin repeat and protein kinase domain-containing protein 1 [Hondaea fermentalgiana]|uniref:Ankyrin repeat and protein kinase domain-containing protein 1 n=1 Tax=Hondaea fermentalgiana TaxID=2315210 RepID=A0A2R5GJT0_9STRA|nr:Ankyrin repeat and protein kinase domain-containing protein 1 [Hondaea fermentalgiana]|eukprot:GBG31137.1 Ankyrin repeat and protein kinase domain-containing protein 1 [Hondaea fermentalgiana]